jgi:integrase
MPKLRACMKKGKLTDLKVKSLKPAEKPYKVFDGHGLYIFVTSARNKIWRAAYRLNKVQKTFVFGAYPVLALADAREKLLNLKKVLAEGLDPASCKNQVLGRLNSVQVQDNSFSAIAAEFCEKHQSGHNERYIRALRAALDNHLFPSLGARPTDMIEAPELLAAIRQVENQGKLNIARKLKVYAGQIFRYAIATGRAKRDITADLKGALKTAPVKHRPSLVGQNGLRRLLLAIDSYQGSPVVKAALKLAPLVFVRPGELIAAEWGEVDLEKAEWRIPEGKMKMKRPHIVPLSRQALEILRELKGLTGGSRFLFPSSRVKGKTLDPANLNNALLALGFSREEMVPHGFRSMASTLLNEQGYNRDWIELQLAHVPGGVRASYNYAQYLPERHKMMENWANYLDSVRAKI